MKKIFSFILICGLLVACSSTKGPRPKPRDVTIAINISSDNSVNFTDLNPNSYLFDLKRELSTFQNVNLVYVDPEEKPQVVLDISIENFYISPRDERTSRRAFSARVQSGTDAAGKPVYQLVSATVDITQVRIPVRANLAYKLTFKDNPPKTTQQRYYENYTWQSTSIGNIQGDSRAIDPSIYAYQRSSVEPFAEEFLMQLSKREMVRRISDDLRKYYPRLKT